MTAPVPTAAVTGASGYLGSRICERLESEGWQVVRLARTPSSDEVRHYDLAGSSSEEIIEGLKSADLLVHAAYDLTLTSEADIWRVNVEGTRRLLAAAVEAQLGRIIVLSSMSAFAGTTQLYGRAKLEIEVMTEAVGGCAVRSGLVYGDRPGGMTGALRKLTGLPVVPVLAGGAALFTVHEDDLMSAIAALATADPVPSNTISVAHPTAVTLRDLMRTFAADAGQRCRFVPVPWQLIYWALRTTELLRLRLPFRADSLLGLVRPAPRVQNGEPIDELGVSLRPFARAQ